VDTEEVLALIEWLHEFNEERNTDDKVRFYGFDAQYTAGPAAVLGEYLRNADPELYESVADDLTAADDGGRDETRTTRLDAADRVVDTLENQLRDRKEDHISATDQRTWRLACQHLRTLAQANDKKWAQHEDDLARTMAVRDRAMAENVAWVLNHENDGRIVLWAHNGHINRNEDRASEGMSAPSMGHHLADRYGERYYALGFDFAHGTFQALAETDDGRELTACSLEAPPDGSVTELFAATNEPIVFADLETVMADDRLTAWFGDRRRIRSVGALYYGESEVENHHDRRIVADAYDGLLFVRETNRALPIACD
jgi:erythromycin esterase